MYILQQNNTPFPCSLAEMSISSSSLVLPPSCGKSTPIGASLWPKELVKERGGLAEEFQMGQEVVGEGVGHDGDRVGVGGEEGRRGRRGRYGRQSMAQGR